MVGELVLELNVFQRTEFGKQSHFLRQIGQAGFAQFTPVGNADVSYVPAIEVDGATIVTSIAIDVAAQRRLSCAAVGHNEVMFAAFHGQTALPHLAGNGFAPGKDRRQRVMKVDFLHL